METNQVVIPVNIGQQIFRIISQNRTNMTAVARTLGVSVSGIQRLLQKTDINTNKLVQISNALNYNFFKLYEPTQEKEDELKKTQQQLKDQEEQLKNKELQLIEKDRRITELEKENKMMKDFWEVLKKR